MRQEPIETRYSLWYPELVPQRTGVAGLPALQAWNVSFRHCPYVVQVGFEKTAVVAAISETRLDDFWKFLVKKNLLKVAQMFGDFWGILKTWLFKWKLPVNFLASLQKLGYFFNPSSGHTGGNDWEGSRPLAIWQKEWATVMFCSW